MHVFVLVPRIRDRLEDKGAEQAGVSGAISLKVLPFHLLPVSFIQSSSHYGGTAVTLDILCLSVSLMLLDCLLIS